MAYHSKFYVNGVEVREEVEAFLPIEVEKFGVYGTSLYGLTVGEECVIGENLLEFRAL